MMRNSFQLFYVAWLTHSISSVQVVSKSFCTQLPPPLWWCHFWMGPYIFSNVHKSLVKMWWCVIVFGCFMLLGSLNSISNVWVVSENFCTLLPPPLWWGHLWMLSYIFSNVHKSLLKMWWCVIVFGCFMLLGSLNSISSVWVVSEIQSVPSKTCPSDWQVGFS